MADYTHQAGANWPESLIELTNYKDVDNTIGPIVAQIKAYQEAGDYDSAQDIINEHTEELKSYVMDSTVINRYIEELRNLQIYTKTHKQQIFYTNDVPSEYAFKNDIWIGDI